MGNDKPSRGDNRGGINSNGDQGEYLRRRANELAAQLEASPRLRFIGGPHDGWEMIWVENLPIGRYTMPTTSLGGRKVADTYRTDPDDPTMLRMIYVGREVVGVVARGKVRKKKR